MKKTYAYAGSTEKTRYLNRIAEYVRRLMVEKRLSPVAFGSGALPRLIEKARFHGATHGQISAAIRRGEG
jgi:hypothetical protein